MQLIDIDKAVYRKHLNRVIIGFIATLLILALVFGQLLIVSFGQAGVSNFKYNLLGVVLAILACAAILHSLKHSVFFNEIHYVWQLKQLHNSIFRKLTKINLAVKEGDEKALIILLFYYQSLQQVYLLDDNTLTLNKVDKELNNIKQIISHKNLTITADQFEKKLLTSYA